MNLETTIRIMAGGPGSGCNPAAGDCGRHPGGGMGEQTGRPTWRPTLNKPTNEFYKDENGHYTPERAALHDQLIDKYEHKPGHEQPVVHLIAGGTASGKTMAARHEYKSLRHPAMVNTDLPRSDLPEFKHVMGTNKGGLLHEEASDIRDQIMASALAHNNDIAMDAVGSHNLAAKLDALEKAGYKVKVTYVHTPVDQSIKAATKRAQTTTNPADKRVVPEDYIRASHDKARRALGALFKPGRDVRIVDGTNWRNRVIYDRTADGKVRTHDKGAVERMRNAKGEAPVSYKF